VMPFESESVAGNAVAVAVQVVDVFADNSYRPSHVGGAVPATAGAVDVAGDGHAGAAVVRVAPSGLFGADRRCGIGCAVTMSSSLTPAARPC
jgi:hypothetical protein